MKRNPMIVSLVFVLFQFSAFSQDTVQSIFISTYLTKPIFNEYSIVIEYKPFRNHVFGITLGDVYSNKHFQVNKLSSSQDKHPGLVYNGFATRALYSYYLASKKNHAFYVSTQFMFKELKYDHHEFIDSWGDKGDNTYIRNENTQLYGLDLLVGWSFFEGLENEQTKLYLNIYLGFGGRYKYRDIETIGSIKRGSPDYIVPLGHTSEEEKYIIPILGLKFGVRFNFHK
jgi:hypothetical protein